VFFIPPVANRRACPWYRFLQADGQRAEGRFKTTSLVFFEMKEISGLTIHNDEKG
jgi:hypothetical protein